MKTIYKTLAILVIFTSNLIAQQTPQSTLWIYDPLLFNPAVAGSNKYPEIKLHHRSQWVGFEGAPVTSLLAYHNELNNKMGIGGFLENDMTGPIRRTSLNAAYAYHLQLKKFFWSFGLSANVMQYNFKGNDLLIYEDGDNSILENVSDSRFKPDATFGTYLYNQDFYLGFSVLQLLGPRVKLFKEEGLTAEMPLSQHFYLTSGYKFYPEKGHEIEPSLLLSKAFGNPMQINLLLKYEYKKKINVGFSYRHKDAVALFAGYRIDRYFIAYSYDISTTRLFRTHTGSHEIVFAFNWPFTPDTKPMYDLKGMQRGQIKKRVY